MPMDDTDKRLLNGGLLFLFIAAVAWFFPWGGLKARMKRQKEQIEDLKSKVESELARNYPAVDPAVFMRPEEKTTSKLSAAAGKIDDLMAEYLRDTASLKKKLEKKFAESRMDFPPWTENIPAGRKPEAYFAGEWRRRKTMLDTECRRHGVILEDQEIGFQKLVESGVYGGMDRNKAQELLRELYIAELIVRRCIEAKKAEEEYEKSKGYRADAYMRIIRVRPEESEATGPWFRELNPSYNSQITNPKDPRSRKYKRVWEGRHFIQEYPVEILLQCDLNTFQRFLYSVRRPKKFLVIRSLRIISPYLRNSKEEYLPELAPLNLREEDLDEARPEHIWVLVSAAGMDFFDPDERDSIYKKKGERKRIRRSRHRPDK